MTFVMPNGSSLHTGHYEYFLQFAYIYIFVWSTQFYQENIH